MKKSEIAWIFFISFFLNILLGTLLPLESEYLKAIISEVLALFLPAYILIRIKRQDFFSYFKIEKIKLLHFILIIVGFLMFFPLYSILSRFLESIFRMPEELVRMFEDLASFKPDIKQNLIIVLAIAVVPAVVEEFLFRGFLQTAISRYLSPAKTIVIVSLLFAFIHLNPWWSIQIFLISLIFSYMRYRTDSIIPCIAIHFLNNLLSIALNTFY